MQYILRKVLTTLITLVLVSLMILFVFQILPGNPAQIILGVEADENQIKVLEEELGLNKPIMDRYLDWISGILRGEMGRSIKYKMPVANLLKTRFPVTLFLTLYSLALTICIGVPLGLWIAAKDGKWYSVFASTLTQLGVSIPAFWMGFILIHIFGVKLGWFPTFGFNLSGVNFLQKMYRYFLPALAISIANIAIVVRYLRSTLLDQIRQEYVRTARIKGLKTHQWLFRHVLRNALIPVLTILGIIMTSSIGGSIVIENVFALPGLGSLMVQSVSSRDFPLIQSLVFFIATMVILINFAVDVLYQVIDPRIQIGE